jgi:hypothetical protein
MRTARDAVDNAVIDYILRHAADEGTQIYELEPLFGLPRHHKVSSEQQRILLAFIEKRVSMHRLQPVSFLMRGRSGFTALVRILHRGTPANQQLLVM